MKAMSYLLCLLFVGAGIVYSFIDVSIGLLVVLLSGTAAMLIADVIKKDWSDRE
jgi:hypothetical protein